MNEVIFGILVIVLLFDYVLERILEYVNAKHRTTPIPEQLKNLYDEQEYQKQQAYESQKSRFGIIVSTFSLVLMLGMLFFKGFSWLDSYIYTEFSSDTQSLHHIWGALLFFGILAFASDILQIPFELYNTFVIEEKFGFNRTTIRTFIFDKLKSWLLMIVLGGGILAGLLLLISFFESQFWIFAWLFISAIMIFFTMFYSSVIVPLFNKQTPLEEGELKEAIVSFSAKVDFKLDNIFVIDGSKRSTKANAYFSGLGAKKRIVLYDTLIQEMSVDEIVAVLAHEIGHYKKRHTKTMIFASLFQMGVLLFILGKFIQWPALTEALNIPFEPGKYHIALFVFSFLYSPLSFLLGIAMNMLSRKHEYEADAYAAKLYNAQSLDTALRKLSKRNLSNLTPHPWYVFFYYSHPPLFERIQALQK